MSNGRTLSPFDPPRHTAAAGWRRSRNGDTVKAVAPHVSVLSTDPARARRFIEYLAGAGINLRTVTSPQDARRNKFPSRSILLLDADFFGADADDVVDSSRPEALPVIVVINEFDRMRWIDLMRRGASDVLREPVSAPALRCAVSAILSRAPWKSHPARLGWGERMLRAGRMALGLER